MDKNKIVIFGTVSLILFTLLLYQNIHKSSPRININIDIPYINNFEMIDNYKSIDGITSNIKLKKDNILIKIIYIKGIDKKASEDYKNYRLKIINSTFEPIRSPYPGRITQERVCPEEFKPVKIITNNPNSTYFLMYSNSRYSYGSCLWNSIKYRTILLFRYCENKKELYQVELFIPIDVFNESYTKMVEKIKCK